LNLLLNAAQAIPEPDPDRHQVAVAIHAAPGPQVVVEVREDARPVPGGADRLLAGEPFDQILCDLQMPGVTGSGCWTSRFGPSASSRWWRMPWPATPQPPRSWEFPTLVARDARCP
jgi:hypothetical protein